MRYRGTAPMNSARLITNTAQPRRCPEQVANERARQRRWPRALIRRHAVQATVLSTLERGTVRRRPAHVTVRSPRFSLQIINRCTAPRHRPGAPARQPHARRPRRAAHTAASSPGPCCRRRSPRRGLPTRRFLRIYVSFSPNPSAPTRPQAAAAPAVGDPFVPILKLPSSLSPAPLFCDVRRGMHDSDVVPRVRPSGSRAEPRVAWIPVRVRVTAARGTPRCSPPFPSLLSPRLAAAHLAEAELPRSPSLPPPPLSLSPANPFLPADRGSARLRFRFSQG
ncbi:hypothetical protein PVAP13_5KG424221 [Panicum virgatum]|uniref:Uncharacterized protein n=1 Tax=Panicum virgatum TaxID=38727 RepID=A0A8T0SLZ7_PANVG|nr:hypothetical protein PVAP13_5KG424221 [Panicum virgatum]